MTNSQRQKLSEIVDLNYEVNQKAKELDLLKYKLEAKKNELRKAMGNKAYDDMFAGFTKLFSPKV